MVPASVGLMIMDDPVLLFRLKDEDLLEAPDDSAFLQSLRFSCARANGVYPPLALVEAFITEEDSAPRVRRLHLIAVDPLEAKSRGLPAPICLWIRNGWQ